MVKMWQEYIEPGDELDPASPMKRSSRNLGDGDLDGDSEDGGPLPEGALTNNLGLDIVVVVTKVRLGIESWIVSSEITRNVYVHNLFGGMTLINK